MLTRGNAPCPLPSRRTRLSSLCLSPARTPQRPIKRVGGARQGLQGIRALAAAVPLDEPAPWTCPCVAHFETAALPGVLLLSLSESGGRLASARSGGPTGPAHCNSYI